MKNSKGITLIELLVFVTIIGILITALGFSFQGWLGGYRIESQVKEMYADLMNARLRAMQQNRAHFVVVTDNPNNPSRRFEDTYQIFEDTNEDGQFNAGDTPLRSFANPKTLEFPIDPASWTGTVTMDTRGLIAPNNTNIRFDIGNNNPDYDCLLLSPTRINIGRLWNGACVAR